ncbi:hypothetical protein ACE939_00870 [Aquimarina sp. W85]|uniref:hypothetical protein n=1 Tax=Aquimarina rhodophyticola TaxID=3342246 RepID=UPI00366E5B66
MKVLKNRKTHALDLSDDELEMVSELSAHNLLLKEIALQLNIDYRSFIAAWRNKESKVYLAHRRGIDQQEIDKNEALLNQVAGGNITAIQMYENNERIRAFNDSKTEIFGI